ncbi:hypothetical protein N7457_006654 [Penicillium paradoxum]|uniref:uncharacterized protein n=1 Tax=Penicillium paradoxum TaxID=176176 RepID=UPI0025483FC9|nr:uncharacterized protein N7457_006654 [Penicillium paradoxum]KAJ5778934.1 hypothetical protein N7457_006654 [Penicillium paradoxum]
MVNGTAAVLEPTFTGYVATTQDALLLFEACLTGVLHHVPRRPHDRERSHLVRSGSVFIYEENASGIKRWTDGVTWSPSRILGNFLVYRELDKPFPPGEKKRAMKKATRRPVPSGRPGEPYPRHDSQGYSPTSPNSGPFSERSSHQSELERALVGSLVDSYGFKDSGLVKKTMSVTVLGVTHHLVSYYSVEDVLRGVLNSPSMVDSLRYIRPRNELTQKQSFRSPIDELDGANPAESQEPSHAAMYGYRPQMMAPPTYTMPTPSNDFYMQPSPYAASHPPQQGPIAGYSMGAPMAAHPAPNQYLPSPGPTVIPSKQEEYHNFRAGPYGGSMDSISVHSMASIPGGSMNTGLSSSLSERNRSTSDHSPSAYRNSSISSRSQATDATSPMDSSTPGTYSRGSFSMGHMENSHPGLDRNIPGLDPSMPRRESNPIHPSYYAADRSQYYAPAPYAATQPMSAWTTTAGTQPQMAQPQI